MEITGTYIHYFFSCKRQLWLFAHGIAMEQNSDMVADGKFVHETSYDRRREQFEEVDLGIVKIDYYDAKNRVIHEIKRSSKLKETHVWQLKYYMSLMRDMGLDVAKGVLEYPTERLKEEVVWRDEDKIELQSILRDIASVVNEDVAPSVIGVPRCKKCSYYDFCYCDE